MRSMLPTVSPSAKEIRHRDALVDLRRSAGCAATAPVIHRKADRTTQSVGK